MYSIYMPVKRSYRRRLTRRAPRRKLPTVDFPDPGSKQAYRRNKNLDWQPLQPARNVMRGAVRGANWVFSKAKGIWVKVPKVSKVQAQANLNNRLSSADNIQNTPGFKFGKQKPLTFSEKVERLTHPPTIFKRQYAWSAESSAGRKAMFGIPINKLTNNATGALGDLYDDIINNASRLTTDSNTVDPTIITAGQVNNKFYIDYYSQKLRMVNSSSNAIEGKIYLYKYKRDCEYLFTNSSCPMTPINLMMLGSTENLVGLSGGQEQTVGQGFRFNTTTAGVNYTANYDMPGSAVNTGGAIAQVDPDLQVMSKHVKDFTGLFFDQVAVQDFKLKPGQQINHWTIFNELPEIVRANMDMAYVKGVSYYIVVEFQGGIVGDSTATTGDNKISIGTVQLSCILEEKRILGIKGRQPNGKIVMVTPALADIATAAQVIINPDTGVADIGVDIDA